MDRLAQSSLEELIELKEDYIKTYIGDTQRPWDYITRLQRLTNLINSKK